MKRIQINSLIGLKLQCNIYVMLVVAAYSVLRHCSYALHSQKPERQQPNTNGNYSYVNESYDL